MTKEGENKRRKKIQEGKNTVVKYLLYIPFIPSIRYLKF